jgi:hypothetical protein
VCEVRSPDGSHWLRVLREEGRIVVDSDRLQAAIPTKNPKHWMTGIEKGSFLDKATGFREAGDGLMVVDWLMEAGSDEAYAAELSAPDGEGIVPYRWYTNETDPERRRYALLAHGSSHRKRIVEGPQLCHRMKPVEPEILCGKDFVAVRTSYRFAYAAPGRTPGSMWRQTVLFPLGERFFLLCDEVQTVNASPEMFLRTDMPGCIRHQHGETFSEVYLSYLGGAEGLRVPAREFLEPFPPDRRFCYRRDQQPLPKEFIRGYRLRDPVSGQEGPWLAGMTLEPSVVYEAWCNQRPGGIVVMILEIHGRPVQPGDSFRAVHLVGWFDSIAQMHELYRKYRGHTGLEITAEGYRLLQ